MSLFLRRISFQGDCIEGNNGHFLGSKSSLWGVEMITWETGAQQEGCKAQGFHHSHTPLVALNRLDFRRLAGEKMGFAGRACQQWLTRWCTPRIVHRVRAAHWVLVIGRFYELVFNVRQCFCFTWMSSRLAHRIFCLSFSHVAHYVPSWITKTYGTIVANTSQANW